MTHESWYAIKQENQIKNFENACNDRLLDKLRERDRGR